MDERKKRVLNAIIRDYITHAEPVGSRTITKKYDLGVSPATVRNEMSDLEEEGYIEQPHTSAGRIPSAKGYRYYVDHLMRPERLNPEQMRQIRAALAGELNEIDDFMRSCCQMISRFTQYTALAAMPEQGGGQVKNIQLVPVSEHQLMAVLTASTGIIRHKLIELSLPPEKLAPVESELRRRLIGREMRQIDYQLLSDMLHELAAESHLSEHQLGLLEQKLLPEKPYRIFTGGVRNMLSQPEFRDMDKLRQVFALLEEDNKLRDLFASAAGDDQMLTVSIGGEMPVEGANDCSMVLANYFVNGEKAGSIGVLGPTRMSYDKTVSLMEFIADELSKVMSDKSK